MKTAKVNQLNQSETPDSRNSVSVRAPGGGPRGARSAPSAGGTWQVERGDRGGSGGWNGCGVIDEAASGLGGTPANYTRPALGGGAWEPPLRAPIFEGRLPTHLF